MATSNRYSHTMKNSTIKNILFNVAGGVIAFTAARAFHIPAPQTFGLLAVVGIGIIALRDYSPRRQVKINLTAAKPVARRLNTRRRVSALVAA